MLSVVILDIHGISFFLFFLLSCNGGPYHASCNNQSKHIPAGMKVKSAILFSMFLIILSRPLLRNIPELVRTLQNKTLWEGIYKKKWTSHFSLKNSLGLCKPAVLTLTSCAVNHSWFFHVGLSKFDQVLTFIFGLVGNIVIKEKWIIYTERKVCTFYNHLLDARQDFSANYTVKFKH